MPVFWAPEALASQVRLVPAASRTPSALRFEPHRWAREVAAHRHEAGLSLILGGGQRELRLWLPRPVAPRAAVMAEIDLDPWVTERTDALGRLMRLVRSTGGVPPPGPRPAMRLIEALRAHDGRQAGATYREIAGVLFGPDTVARLAWQTSAPRAGVIRLVETGHRLVAGGYRDLLKPSRPLVSNQHSPTDRG